MKRVILVLIIILSSIVLMSCKNESDITTSPSSKKEVSIIFNTGTSEVFIESLTGIPGTSLEEPNVTPRAGYRFSHWELNGSKYSFSVFPSRSIVLDAVWNKVYVVNFDVGNGHDPIAPLEIGENESLDSLPALTHKIDYQGRSYKFLYWTYEGVKLPFSKMPNTDILLTAKWEETLLVSFNTGNSNSNITPIFAGVGEAISAPKEVPILDDHIFTGWSLNGRPYIFNTMPSQSIQLVAEYVPLSEKYNSQSTLPKMFINLENNYSLDNVNRETYVNSSITLHGIHDEELLAAVASEFKGRGHGSWTDSGPKRGYRLKFFSKQSLLGEAKSKHWVLLAGANFYDPTLAKNAAAFNMARDVFSNIEYTTPTHWLELYINGEYRGVYLLAEHVRVDKARINIDAEFGVLDTGYLIEYDAYATEAGPEGLFYFRVNGFKHPFEVKRPDPDDFIDKGISEQLFRAQVSFIKDYTTQTLQAALNKDLDTFMNYADINSFIDMYLLHELFKNTDTGWSSFYMYKKPGGKLYAGAAWDFDASAGKNRGDTSPTGFFVSDSVRHTSDHTASELYISLMQIPEFRTLVAQRWKAISNDVKLFVNTFLSDEFITLNEFAFGRNFEFWSNSGPDYGHYPSIEIASERWGSSVRELRAWLISRSEWFDSVFS